MAKETFYIEIADVTGRRLLSSSGSYDQVSIYLDQQAGRLGAGIYFMSIRTGLKNVNRIVKMQKL